jgi:hypothetical protein
MAEYLLKYIILFLLVWKQNFILFILFCVFLHCKKMCTIFMHKKIGKIDITEFGPMRWVLRNFLLFDWLIDFWTNMAWIPVLLCKLQKGCTRLTATSDKVYQLLAHGRWFSPGTLASSTTKTGRHDIAEILALIIWNALFSQRYVITIYPISYWISWILK